LGGGENHRFALYDMIMLKDNHIDFAWKNSCGQTKITQENGLDLKIIVEARDFEVKEIVACEGVYRILLIF
jgi:nicotinate-nucleotide pyrophosphorylase (carboxylating)